MIIENNVEDTSLILQKMIFIYNALLNGWTIRMLEKNKFEFIKDKESIKREVDLSDYLRKFIQYNLNIENLRT
jgi:hypothetical protein